MPIAKQLVLFAGCLPEAPFAEYVDAAASRRLRCRDDLAGDVPARHDHAKHSTLGR